MSWWEEYPVVETPQDQDSGPLGFLNRGIASAVGAPVDVMNWAISPVTRPLGLYSEQPLGGARSLGQGMRAIDAEVAREDEQPEGYVERAAEGVGLAAGSLLPGAGMVGAASRAGGPVARGVAGEMARPFLRTPGRAMAIETAAGAGAGAGGLAAERGAEGFVDPTLARVAGELVGGFGAAVAPGMAARTVGATLRKAPLTGTLIRAGRAALIPFTESGARVRASRRLQELSGAPAEDAARVTGDTISGLTPAQETGNPRLMALERAILDQDAQLDRQFKARSKEGTQALREALREPAGTATPQDAQAFLQQRQDYIRGLIEHRIQQAEERAEQAIAKLTPALKETEASTIYRRELENALRDARAQERELWAAVPKDVTVPTTSAKQAYREFQQSLGRPLQKHIPDEAREFLDPDRNSAFAETASVRDMHALYSDLRETARVARANGNMQRARIADGIAEPVMRDLDSADVGRHPGALADAEDAFQHQQDVDRFFQQYDQLSREVSRFARRPVTQEVIRRGGIDPQSPAAVELKAMGVTPQSAPGLFRRGGLKDLDNLPLDEFADAAERGLALDGQGYVSRQSLLDAIREEVNRRPSLTGAQRALADELAEMERLLPEYEQYRADMEAGGRVERPFPGDYTDAEVTGPLAAARAYSRQLNQTFRQGRVGDILGHEREGGASVPPEMTLGQTIGTGGARGAVAADELMRATQGSTDAEAAMRDYLRRRFMDYAAPRGEMAPRRAQDFLRENAELLDRFPDLKREIEDASGAGLAAERTRRTDQGRLSRLTDPRRSTGAAFAQAPYAREFQTILRAPEPRTAARELKRQVAKDETGQALRGLKASVLDHLMDRAGAADGTLSAGKLRELLAAPRIRAAAAEILDPADMHRLGRIVTELDKATPQGRGPRLGGVMEDVPSTIISYVARVLGARAGAQAGAGTSGASLLTAHLASQRVKQLLHNLTNDRAAQLLSDAIQDPELFRSLLVSPDTPQKAARVERRLVEWLGAETGQAIEHMRGREAGQSGEGGDWWLDYPEAETAPQPRSEAPRSQITPAHAHVDLASVDERVLGKFTRLQSSLGMTLPITSGYRSPAHNRKVGGAKRSQHMHGKAIDIDVSGLSRDQRLDLIRRASALGFTGIGIYDDSIHLDLGRKRAWGPSYKFQSVPAWAKPVIKEHMAGKLRRAA